MHDCSCSWGDLGYPFQQMHVMAHNPSMSNDPPVTQQTPECKGYSGAGVLGRSGLAV